MQSGKLTEKILKENTGSDKGKLVPTDIGTIVTDFLVKNFGAILDYNFTAKVEQDFDEIAEGNIEWAKMMQEFYDKFHPNVKDVEANADRESGERILGTDPATGKPVSVRLGKFGPMAQIGDAEDEDKKFASLKIDQNIGNISLEDALNLFLLPKNLGLYKGEEVEVSNGRYGPYIRHGAAFISLPKGEDPLDVSMERAQELIDEKAQADAPIAIYKGLGVQKGVGRFGAFIKWDGLFINVSKKYNFDNLSQEDIEAVVEVLKSDFLTQGPMVPKFENSVAKYLVDNLKIAPYKSAGYVFKNIENYLKVCDTVEKAVMITPLNTDDYYFNNNMKQEAQKQWTKMINKM